METPLLVDGSFHVIIRPDLLNGTADYSGYFMAHGGRNSAVPYHQVDRGFGDADCPRNFGLRFSGTLNGVFDFDGFH